MGFFCLPSHLVANYPHPGPIQPGVANFHSQALFLLPVDFFPLVLFLFLSGGESWAQYLGRLFSGAPGRIWPVFFSVMFLPFEAPPSFLSFFLHWRIIVRHSLVSIFANLSPVHFSI